MSQYAAMPRNTILALCLLVSQTTLGQSAPAMNLTAGTEHQTIGDAVNSATPGDFIQLAAGIFEEHVAISIPLTLAGATSGGTLIDVSKEDGWGITLSTDHITIQDLAIAAGGVNMSYAIHSEPGITGLTIDNVDVFGSTRTCIDLNGLTGPEVNTIRDILVSGSAIGFGLALSTCSHVLIENVFSIANGFGDIAIMESNHYDQDITGVAITGELDLRGPQSLGGGGVVIQINTDLVSVGIGPSFPINVNADGFDKMIEAPGDLTGCILVHNKDVRHIAQTLGGTITDLVARDLYTADLLVYPGMKIQPALDVATAGQTVWVDAGAYDTIPLAVGNDVTLIGNNAGVPADSADLRTSETLISGIVVQGGHATIDGIRIEHSADTAVRVQDAASGLTLRNSLIIGEDIQNSIGIQANGDVQIEHSRISRCEVGVLQTSGSLELNAARLNANATGIAIASDQVTLTHLTDAIFENPGGTGLHVQSAPQESQVVLLNSSLDLHQTALKVDYPVDLASVGSSYTNSESQTEGVSTELKVALCSENVFDPALRIPGCMDLNAHNHMSCATIDFGCEYLGCTSPRACNFSADANVDDGSCDFVSCAGCPLDFACNYDPDAALYQVETCSFLDCDEGMAASSIDRAGLTMLEGCTMPQACNFNPDALVEDGTCAFDCYGCLDTDACNHDPSFSMASNETCLYKQDLYGSSHVDCDGVCLNDTNDNGVCDEEEVSGCMDFGACNFLAEATLDGGQCEFQSCAGCTNPEACNYNPSAVITDGNCDYESCKGCTNPESCNPTSGATLDDGTCTFPVDLYNVTHVDCNGVCLNDTNGNGVCDEVEVPGCMDATACDFNVQATLDDGSCDYDTCAGCTNVNACNYDPGARIDNGQCSDPLSLYPDMVVEGVPVVDCLGRCLNDADLDGICDEFDVACPGDVDEDGVRGASDILMLLYLFGCASDCGPADMNGDGLVAASDILHVLSTYGVPCQD